MNKITFILLAILAFLAGVAGITLLVSTIPDDSIRAVTNIVLSLLFGYVFGSIVSPLWSDKFGDRW